MEVPCIGGASKACSSCCTNPFHGLPESSSNQHTKSTRIANNPQRDFVAAIASSMHPNYQFTNHESLPSMTELLSSLHKTYPQLLKTNLADQIRSQEYYHLSLLNRVCLDYIGQGLFSFSQLENRNLRDSIASNVPFFDISCKAANLDSQSLLNGDQESDFESSMRKRIMKYMNVSEDDYSMVFTANHTSAFKLLTDLYPFRTNRKLLTVYDYKSEETEATIESSKKKGAQVMSAEFLWPCLRINSRELRKMVLHKGNKKKRGLFVFPLQSRMTGTRYPYRWMNMARENGWHILLDADAMGAKEMETMGLSIFQPDFLICSFFKVFGENPSGFSCLFVKKSSISALEKSSTTSIGIVSLVPSRSSSRQSTSADIEIKAETSIKHLMKGKSAVPGTSSSSIEIEEINEETFELEETKQLAKTQKEPSSSEFLNLDRTVEANQQGSNEASSSRSTEIECRGLDHADAVGLILISMRTKYLVNWLVNALLSLRHPHPENGDHLVRIYGPKLRFDRGPAVAFNVFDWKGEKVDPMLVQKLADRHNISLTCGFLQQLWFSDKYSKEKEQIVETKSTETATEKPRKRSKSDAGISVVTVSVGFLTNFEDLYRLWAFVSRFLDADFVEKERWRYTALNQTKVEV